MACAWRFGDRMRTPADPKFAQQAYQSSRKQTADRKGEMTDGTGQFSELYRTRMDGAAGEDHTPGTPELKRTYLSLLPHAALVDLVLSVDAGTTSIFPADLRGEVRRMQAAADDADGEGSPDPQPTPAPRAPSVPPAGGPRTRAGAARAYAAALAKDAASTRPSPAPGGISFPQTPEPPAPPAFAPIPQPYPSLVVHLPGGSPPAPSASTPSTPAPGPPPDPWQSPQADSNAGPVRNTPAKKTRTGVIGGFNPITSIGPSSEGLPSYEEMIVLALMENQDGQGIAPKDVFAWMSARWPLNANFRPSASQALQKAYKRGRLEKVGTKYKLNPNWHGGATTNRTTRRPQSMAELPGNYAWAPPPVPPITAIPPDPRARSNSVTTPAPAPAPAQPPPPTQPSDFDAHAQVASLLKALQEAGPSNPNPAPNPVGGTDQNQNPNPMGDAGNSQPQSLPHLAMPQPGSAPVTVPGQVSPTVAVPVTVPGPAGSPTVAAPLQHPIPQPPPVPMQAGMPPPPPQPQPQPQQNPIAAPQPHPHPVAAGHPVPLTYPPFHPAPTALQASLATLASQLANMSKTNQGA